MAITKALRGPDVKVFINGRLYSPVVSIRWSATTGRHAISGVDQTSPFELAIGQTSIKGSFEVVRIRASGGLEGAGIAAPESKILQEKYFSLTVVDRLTDTVLLQVDECAVIDQNWNAAARGVVAGAFTFEGIGWVNEVDI